MLVSHRLATVHVEFTSRCNLKCVFCFASQPEYVGADLDAGTLGEIIGELNSRKINMISVNGHGETTIYPNWHVFADRLLAGGKSLHITSNFAKRFSGAEIRTLAKFKSIEISCDCVDPDLFVRLRRGAELQTVIANLEKVKKAASQGSRMPKISFSCVVSNMNVFALQALAAFGKDLGVGHFNFCNLTKFPDVENGIRILHITEMPIVLMLKARQSILDTCLFLEQSGIEYDIQAGLLDSLNEHIESAGGSGRGTPLAEAKETSGNDESAPRMRRYFSRGQAHQTRDCLDPWSFMMVNSRREVLPCCWHHAIGNLGAGQSLFDVFNNTRIQILRQQLLTGELSSECRECPSRGWISRRDLHRKVQRHLHNPIRRLFSHRMAPVSVSTKAQYPINYSSGWYDLEKDPNIPDPEWNAWRWTGGKAVFCIENPRKDFTLRIRGSVNKSKFQDQTVSIHRGDELIEIFLPFSARFVREYVFSAEKTGISETIGFSIETNRVFVPALTEKNSDDYRELGLQVYEIFLGEQAVG